MKSANVRFTYQDYLQLPEDKRYEILDGDLYVVAAPNTKHQRISKKLEMILIRHVEDKGLGEVFDAPYDVILSQENVAQPDILVVRKARSRIVGELNVQGAPDLIVEILSPGTRNKDLEVKKKIYARFGVQEYWIVDPDASTIEVFRWGEAGYTATGVYGRDSRFCSPLLPQLDLKLSEIF
jgi:Uma2 family endonuclease